MYSLSRQNPPDDVFLIIVTWTMGFAEMIFGTARKKDSFPCISEETVHADATSVDFKESFSEAVEIINMILAKHHIKHEDPYDPNVDWKLILCELADFAAMAYRTYHLFGSDYDLQNEGSRLSRLRSRCQRHLESNCSMNVDEAQTYFYENGDSDLVGRSKGFGPR